MPNSITLAPGFDPTPITAQDRWTLAIQSGAQVDVLYRPTLKGAEFHELTVANAILEGPRGTGKSVILRNDAHIHALSCDGLDYLIVRRTMPELRMSHLKFIEAEMKRLGGTFNKTESIAYYPERLSRVLRPLRNRRRRSALPLVPVRPALPGRDHHVHRGHDSEAGELRPRPARSGLQGDLSWRRGAEKIQLQTSFKLVKIFERGNHHPREGSGLARGARGWSQIRSAFGTAGYKCLLLWLLWS
jgi:hypothetical protein